MRAIPSSLDPFVVSEVDRRLVAASADHDVCIPWAIESGSRAWGFPSPDSDYDCRFIFVRRREHYLTLWPPRDVIETPLDKTFDVNGWDLAKTVRLITKGELGAGTPPVILTQFVTNELDRAKRFEALAPERDPAVVRSIADHFFRTQVG